MVNSVINFLPAGRKYVIERFGKFHRIALPGLRFLVPLVDKIAYVVDDRELCFRIDPEQATTKDNVGVELGGNLYIQFCNAERAAYGATNPIYAVSQLAQSVMRSSVGGIQLDRLFAERAIINQLVVEHLSDEVVGKWGCHVLRFEITDLCATDSVVADSLHKQSTAERDRREKIIAAEAHQQEVKLTADAYLYRQTTEAQGDANKIRVIAEAQANSVRAIAQAIQQPGGQDAVATRLTQEYFKTLEQLGKSSHTTLVIPQNLADVSSMVAVGKTVLDRVGGSGYPPNSGSSSALTNNQVVRHEPEPVK